MCRSRSKSAHIPYHSRCVQNFIQIGWDLAVQGPKTCFWVKTEHGQAWPSIKLLKYLQRHMVVTSKVLRTCERLAQGRYRAMRRPGVELTTCWLQVQRPKHYTTSTSSTDVTTFIMKVVTSVPWHCWLGDRKVIRPVKSWVLVCLWWRFDWSFARLMAPVVTTTSIILSFKTG